MNVLRRSPLLVEPLVVEAVLMVVGAVLLAGSMAALGSVFDRIDAAGSGIVALPWVVGAFLGILVMMGGFLHLAWRRYAAASAHG